MSGMKTPNDLSGSPPIAAERVSVPTPANRWETLRTLYDQTVAQPADHDFRSLSLGNVGWSPSGGLKEQVALFSLKKYGFSLLINHFRLDAADNNIWLHHWIGKTKSLLALSTPFY